MECAQGDFVRTLTFRRNSPKPCVAAGLQRAGRQKMATGGGLRALLPVRAPVFFAAGNKYLLCVRLRPGGGAQPALRGE